MADPTSSPPPAAPPTRPAETPEPKPPRDTEQWRRIAGRIFGIVLIVVMVLLVLLVWDIVEKHPRTDDAIALANVIGVAPRVIPQPVVRIRPVTVSGFHDMRAHRRDRRQDDIASDDARHLGIMRSYIRRAYLRMPLKHAGAIASI